MDRFQRDFPCTICHDYGSDECDCPRADPKDATIARIDQRKEAGA